MDAILICLGAFILLYVCLRAPQWVANKTGKTIRFRGTFTNYITYKPDEWEKAQKQLKEASDHVEQLNQSLYSRKNIGRYMDNPYSRITDVEKEEYGLFSLSLREQIQVAISEHIVTTDYSNIDERLKIKPWLVKYLKLYETINAINISQLSTLVYDEYSQIEQFKSLFQKDFDSIVEKGGSGTGHNFI